MKQMPQSNNLNRKRVYGYGEIEKTEFSSEQVSCVWKREDIGRTDCVRGATDCNLGVVLEN
jgi:hypothetical protein